MFINIYNNVCVFASAISCCTLIIVFQRIISVYVFRTQSQQRVAQRGGRGFQDDGGVGGQLRSRAQPRLITPL